MLTFAEWQALGMDPNSSVANPQLTSSFQPTNPAATTAGWLAGNQPRLTLYVPQDKFLESAGSNASSVTIFRSGMSLAQPLTVTLTTSDSSEIELPATWTIPANATSAVVPIKAKDDNLFEPTRGVQIFASASYAGQPLQGSEWVRVLQDTVVQPPTLSISDASVVEGDPGGVARSLVFTVTLSSSALSFPNVTVNYVTSNGDAQGGVDYTAATGQLSFTSTMRSKTITVPIRSDLAKEPNEMLFVRLSNPVNATISDNEGQGTIIDDDTPQLSINDISVGEGKSGSKLATFTVSLSKAISQVVSFRATTRSATATEGQDFQAKNQVVSIPAGSRTASFSVVVYGDTRLELEEKFTVTISEVVCAGVTRATGIGTIVNDDLPLPAAADKMGVVRNGHDWYLDTAGDGYLAERTIGYGLLGDRNFTADMNKDGREELVVARNNFARGGIDWYIDYNGDGNLGESIIQFGLLGDIPLIGDFDANDRDDLAAGRWNPARGGYDWYLDTAGNGNLAEKTLQYGLAGDMFLTGDFNGDRRDELIAVRKNTSTGGLNWYFDLLGNGGAAERTLAYGLIGDVPIMGDWNGDGLGDDMAVVRRNEQRGGLDWYFDLLGDGDTEDKIIEFGLLGDLPVAGKWR